MTEPAILPINFTISEAAKAEIENLRKAWNAEVPDPAAVLAICWGIFMPYGKPAFEDVVVTFYGESQLASVAGIVQEVSGLKAVFFTTTKHHPRFEGKVLDHSGERGFFLR